MGQYSDYYDSDEPTPIPDGYEWANEINGSLERLDRSTQALVQLFLDDGTAYAIHDGDVLASGPNHGRVIQSAIDWVFTNRVDTSSDPDGYQLAGWIDGGSETYNIGQQIYVKGHIGLSNIDLDANGASLGGDAALRLAPVSGRYQELVHLSNLMVRGNASGPGIMLHQCGYGTYLDTVSTYANAGDGIVIAGGVGVLLVSCWAKQSGNAGIRITDTSNSDGNLNRLYNCAVGSTGDSGFVVKKTDALGDSTDNNLIDSCTSEYNAKAGYHISDGAHSTTIRNSWAEKNNGVEYLVDAPNASADKTVLKHNRASTIEIGASTGTVLQHNFNERGFGGDLDITITADATDTVLDNNVITASLGGDTGIVTDNGKRTVRNGVGLNIGDPSAAGEWDGHGYEGALVYDTSGGRPWTPYRYVGGQWQQSV